MNWIKVTCLCVLCWGCATKKFVSTEIEKTETRTATQIEALKRAVEETQTEIRDLAKEMDVTIEGLEENTQDLNRIASDNAQMILQMGQLRFQKTLSESEANFKSDKSELLEGAQAELDKFAGLLVTQNKLAHIEIQGHTDSRGSKQYNLKLGLERAEAVREYLYKQHDIPLHLMNVISFGPDKPIADNGTREGRALNRRVVLVVRIQI